MKFEWDENCQIANGCIYQSLSRAYNSWKGALAAKILKHSDPKDALDERHNDISVSDWQWWIDYVFSTEYQV